MIPKSLSASSLQVAALCMDRWTAEYVRRSRGSSNVAADTGTAVHGALEKYVEAVFLKKTHEGLNRVKQKELLITLYQMSYVETFKTADMETDHYKDGFDLCMKWFQRTDLATKRMIGVLSVEKYNTIPVPYNLPDGSGQAEVPFNYIMDRVDHISETVYEVIDYKTIRVPINPQDLENKLQARAYALAIQIEHPEATEVIVTFDLLRHDPVSLKFTRDDNIAFWRFLCAETQRIVNTDISDVRPTLNSECGYCVKKATCKLLQTNIQVGGVHSLSVDQAIDLAAKIKSQMNGQKRLLEELDDVILNYAADSDLLDWVTEDNAYAVEVSSPRRRAFDAQQAADIMGPALFAQMGNMTLTNLEKIIKDESLDAEMRAELKNLIAYQNSGNLSVKIKPNNKLV